MVTKAYVEKNGSRWNETDYHMALKAIFEHVQVGDSQKLQLARNTEETPMAMICDCSQCKKEGACAKETPTTLDDVRRISGSLGTA